MPIVPIRDLGSAGVRTDTDPYDNSISEFTFASNARFEDKRITRGPVFSTTGLLALNTSPTFAFSYKQASGAAKFHVANRDGTITDWASGGIGVASVESTISPVSWTPSNYDLPYTKTVLNDLVFLNRPDRVPWYKATGSTLFAPLPNVGGLGWDPTWRCAALREVGNVLVAINCTKSGVSYPTMVKTSDFSLFQTPPAQWVASTTNSATEQVVSEMTEALVDGLPLRDKLILYTENETWAMEPRYDNLMFNYRRLFTVSTSSGIINQNCAAEYNNIHFVFGSTDIWSHDGFQRKSLGAGRVRDFVYNSMDRSQSSSFFVMHNPKLTEMMFCYVSDDSYCRFPKITGGGCNRACVYNYRSSTFYFYDLPYLTGGSLGSPFVGSTYTSIGSTTYSSLSGSFASFEDGGKQVPLMVGYAASGSYGSLACAVRSFDRSGQSSSNGVIDTVATAPVIIENAGIDLDALPDQLKNYKVISCIYPEGSMELLTDSMVFQFATKDHAGSPNNPYDDGQGYNAGTDYKLDYRSPGRFVAMKITFAGYGRFSLSGFDIDMVTTGRR